MAPTAIISLYTSHETTAAVRTRSTIAVHLARRGYITFAISPDLVSSHAS